MSGRFVITRHGESEWNAKGVWTGITDVHLTEKGYHEAALMGELLKDIPFHYAYASPLIRTHETLYGILDASGQPKVPYEFAAAITERDYGKLTGKNKWQVEAEIGEEAFRGIRRGWDYPVPSGETLKMVYERSVPFYVSTILPRLMDGQNVLICAHGNSIRSLMKYIESISDEAIADVEMIFGTAVIYTVDENGKMLSREDRRIDSQLPPA